MQPLRNATNQQLVQAEVTMHREVFIMITQAQQGEVMAKDGLLHTFSANGPQPGGMVLFPELNNDNAGSLLDEMMDYYRAHKATDLGCWSLMPSQPADLGIRLLARGFQPGWWPCWMSLDLETIRNDEALPPGVEIRADNETETHALSQLPYNGDNGMISHKVMQTYPDRIQRFLAFKDGKVVGQTAVVLTTNTPAVAGVFDVGVVPEMRKQGIGRAVLLAACRHAKTKGYQYALLNATGRPMYIRAGFQWIGDGRTWWLKSDRYITHPPAQQDIQFAEAVGKGDTAALNKLAHLFTVDKLNTPIANGMTLMELAVHCKQPNAAAWLLQQGAHCTPLDAWNMGWKEQAAEILSKHPQEVNRTYGHLQQTLLHTAAERNDLELASLALSAKPDLTIRDKVHNATPLDWAEFFKRKEMIELIKN